MRKPLTAALLLGGHLLMTFSPLAVGAASASPAPSTNDSHYRCMYRCAERGYGRDGYGHDGYRHDGYGYRYDGYRYDHYRDGRYDHHGCWYHDDWGWHRCGYYHRW
ncbi:MAG TPA: hypothetical protein VFE55_22950 [Acidimicrobiia bacterium]|nr:hypothetical protein [Acidimicrobiia bacterium]